MTNLAPTELAGQPVAIFLDRDGVINQEVGYLHRREDFVYVPNVIDGLKVLSSLGYLLFIVTNQSGIGRGYYSDLEFESLMTWLCDDLARNSVKIHDYAYCPHHPSHAQGDFLIACDCRKPAPGMILELANQYSVNLSDSILVGDKVSDISAGRNAGVGLNILVRSGHKLTGVCELEADRVYDDIYNMAIDLKKKHGGSSQ